MENYCIEATKYTPYILLETNCNIVIKGSSYPENTFEFYAPTISWLGSYFKNSTSPKNISINMEIIYFNSSTSKLFYDIFDIFRANNGNFNISINWIYDKDNEQAKDAGTDFKDDFLDLNFNLVAK